MPENRASLPRQFITHEAKHAALDELDYRKQNGRFPIEQVGDALAAAFPIMLRAFLYSDDARDITGAWGFTPNTGDKLRESLIEAAGGDIQEVSGNA